MINISLRIWCFRNYTDSPYCPTGYTFGFWFRTTLNYQDAGWNWCHILRQGTGHHGGISFTYKNGYSRVWLENIHLTRSCDLNPYAINFDKQWHFLAISYNPNDQKIYCALNKNYIVSSNPASASQSIGLPFQFGGGHLFYIDDVFYYPKFSTHDMMLKVYERSKWCLHFILFEHWLVLS